MNWILEIGLLLCGVYAASPFCLDGEKSLVAGTRCRKYVECENSRLYLKQCQVGRQFVPRTQSCKPAGVLKCKDSKAKCEEGKTFSHPRSDNLYYKCEKGRIFTKYCGAGEAFDHETEECQAVHSSIRSFKRNRRSADEACEENSKRRDGKSCKGYLECINGEEVSKTCPDCMNFDEVQQSCRFNMVLPCGPNSDMPTRPPKPPTTPQPKPEPTTAKPEPEPTTAEPRPEPTTAEPKPDPTTAKPEPEPTTAKPEPEPSTAQPIPEPSTAKPQPEPSTAKPQPEPSTAKPQPEPSTAKP